MRVDRRSMVCLAVFAGAMTLASVVSLAQPPARAARGPIEPAPKPAMPLVIYSEHDDASPPFISTGWMGNLDGIEQDEACRIRPHGGQTCISARYTDTVYWGGVAWLNPKDNWGDQPGGYDLREATRLVFWARGENGGEEVEFKIGIKQEAGKPYKDTARLTTGKITLKTWWKKYAIPLNRADLSRVISGFVWVVEGREDPTIFYLDDIQYE